MCASGSCSRHATENTRASSFKKHVSNSFREFMILFRSRTIHLDSGTYSILACWGWELGRHPSACIQIQNCPRQQRRHHETVSKSALLAPKLLGCCLLHPCVVGAIVKAAKVHIIVRDGDQWWQSFFVLHQDIAVRGGGGLASHNSLHGAASLKVEKAHAAA